jgi:hypothetical protein
MERQIMDDIIGKPFDPSATGRAVANSPPKPTSPPIRERILGPVSTYPLVKNVLVTKTISMPATITPVSSIEGELAEIKRAWRIYQTTNSRDAIYLYLEALFALVARWRRLNCAFKNSRAALRLRGGAPQIKPEPFSIVIFCTSDSEVEDAKTRSKWSRVLRYARKARPGEQHLTDFIKSKGGLNECARRFARNRRSVSDPK